jgi:hypothetical protein
MNKKTRKNKIIKRRGGMSGIMPKQGIDTENAFKFFLDNSKITYLSEGSNGITFILTLDKSKLSDSPYVSSDAKTYGNPVQKIILKVVLISQKKSGTNIELNPPYNNNGNIEIINLVLANEKDFMEEIEVQKDVYLKTMNFLEPICPAIVYSNVCKGIERQKLLNKLLKSDSNRSFSDNYGNNETYHKIQSLSNYATPEDDKYDSIGVIGMEFADGYFVLDDLYSSKKFKLYKEMTLYLLLVLALKTGYSHSDFHYGNIMINPNDGNYFIPTNSTEPTVVGKPLLLDFGLSVKIPDDKLNMIKEYCDNKQYTNALNLLCTIKRKDDLDLAQGLFMYGWVCGAVDPNKNTQQIDNDMIYEARNRTQNFIKKLPTSIPENERNKLIEKEGLRQYLIIANEMLDPKNMRFPPNTNEMISTLFKQRERAEFVLKENFKSLSNVPKLPLTDMSKEKIVEELENPKINSFTSLNSIKLSDEDSDEEIPELVPINKINNINSYNNNNQNINQKNISQNSNLQEAAKISFMKNNNNNNNTKTQNKFKYNPLSYFYSNKKPKNPECNVNNLTQLKTLNEIKSNYTKCCPKTRFGYKNTSPYCKQLEKNLKGAEDSWKTNIKYGHLLNRGKTHEYIYNRKNAVKTQQPRRKFLGLFGGRKTRRMKYKNKYSLI